VILQLAALGSKALTQNAAGTEDEVVAAWFVGVLFGGTVLALVVASMFNLVKRERWRRDVRLIFRKSSDADC
jgi:hypothetical protein